MIKRELFLNKLDQFAKVFPISALVGPRQCGKTTLALEYAKQFSTYHHFDLEDTQDAYRLSDPKITLQHLTGLIIIDEVQRMPSLFPYLRVHVDRNPESKFLLLGSASPELMRQRSESLAGRIGHIELTPFHVQEVKTVTKLWHRGGFPKSYLASTNEHSRIWLKQYILTFLERDIRAMGFSVSPEEMRKLWIMSAHYHGNLVNYTELGKSLNVSDMTIRKYLSILEQAFMIRLLKPWHENISKRQVKSPKLYVRDSGIFHNLFNIQCEDLALNPKIGASFEGFALEEVIRHYQFEKEDCYFWRTHDGAELDLLTYQHGKRVGFEFKYSENIRLTKSMHIAMNDLKLDKLIIVTPGNQAYVLNEKIDVLGINQFMNRTL